ncbi:MAG: hypothetical protein QXP98_10620 [Thermoproteus sp.]
MILRLIYVRDSAIIEAQELTPCGDAFSFKIEGGLLSICGNAYELSEEVPKFRRAVLRTKSGVYLVECDDDMNCIAAKTRQI